MGVGGSGFGMVDGGSLAGKLDSMVSSSVVSTRPFSADGFLGGSFGRRRLSVRGCVMAMGGDQPPCGLRRMAPGPLNVGAC